MATERRPGSAAIPGQPPGRSAAAPPLPVAFKKSTLREYFESIVIAVILALFIRTFVVQAFKIPSGSMENNLLGALLVTSSFWGRARRVSSGAAPSGRSSAAMSSCSSAQEPERDFIKGVISLPGEKSAAGKKVYINVARSTSHTCTT
jgi:signal peptidase I